jgi:hypothetical protein
MNVSISYFAQRLSASLMVYALFLSLITSCAKTAKDEKTSENIISEDIVDIQLSPEIQARLDSMDTELELPEGLTQEEQVTYIENHVLKTPVSVIELLALQPVHTLDPDERNWDYITEAGWAKFRLMNRFMRMQYVALGDPMDELRWVVATQVILDDYATPLGITQEQAIDSLLSAADFLCGGTQYQINQCTYVMASVEYYKTLAAYKTFIEQMPKDLQPLLYEEYTAWNKLNKARHNAYVNIVRAGEHYSALPMEYEGMYAAYAEKRRQLLETEMQILSAGKAYSLHHPVVRTVDWENYLQTLRDRCESDEASDIVDDLDEAVSVWISVRQKIARHLPPSVGTCYDNLTADYHWGITNEEEQVPEMYG